MFNLLAANLHDGNAHDLASILDLIGNSFRSPGENRFLQTNNRFLKKSGFNIVELTLNDMACVISCTAKHSVLFACLSLLNSLTSECLDLETSLSVHMHLSNI